MRRAGRCCASSRIPGVYHRGGGDGLARVDVPTPLMQWVGGGHAPEAIVAST